MKTKAIEQLARDLASMMVSHPDDLIVDVRAHTATMSIAFQGHAADTNKLIGEGAANYRALVMVMRAAGAKLGVRVQVPPIREPSVGLPERYRFQPDPNWPEKLIERLARRTVAAVFEHEALIRVDAFQSEPDYTTTLEIFVSRSEKPELVTMLAGPLARLFDAIGRTHGRVVILTVIAEGPAAEQERPQPATAAGRYVGET
jgi:predicted RNA-binding protein YlqC (UPF0109 family)